MNRQSSKYWGVKTDFKINKIKIDITSLEYNLSKLICRVGNKIQEMPKLAEVYNN